MAWKSIMIDFIRKLIKEEKIELVEPSRNISGAYDVKSKDCLKAAKILIDASLFENSIAQSYYAMYNAIQSCLFRVGIKCENHSAAIYFLDFLFSRTELKEAVFKAKKNRIDSQYYITGKQNKSVTKENANDMINLAEQVMTQLALLRDELIEKNINEIREKIESIS